jgi:hypothetical protein
MSAMFFQSSILGVVRTCPKQTMLHITSFMILIEPRLITTPVFWVQGFESKGPRESMMRCLTFRVLDVNILQILWHLGLCDAMNAQSLYATIQSAAMGGYGTDTAASVARAGVVVCRLGRRRAVRLR